MTPLAVLALSLAAPVTPGPFCVENGWMVVVLDGEGVTRDTVREVARLLAPVRCTVCDRRPPFARPGDYVECRVGPMDWAPGRSGWCNVRLGPFTPRYSPVVVYAARPDARAIAHEVLHTLLGFAHHPAANNVGYPETGVGNGSHD